MASLPPISARFINENASKGSAARGAALVSEVEIIDETSCSVSAQVVSSSGYGSYEVSVEWEEDDESTLDCECSCPDSRGGWCKHSCAVLHYLLRKQQGGASSSPKAATLKAATPKAATPKVASASLSSAYLFGSSSPANFSLSPPSSSSSLFTSSSSSSAMTGIVADTLPWMPPSPATCAPSLSSSEEALSQFRSAYQRVSYGSTSVVSEALLAALSRAAEMKKDEAFAYLDRLTNEWQQAANSISSRGADVYFTFNVASSELASLWLRLLMSETPEQGGDVSVLKQRISRHNLRTKLQSCASLCPSAACFTVALQLVNSV